jgi:hypothetical protein
LQQSSEIPKRCIDEIANVAVQVLLIVEIGATVEEHAGIFGVVGMVVAVLLKKLRLSNSGEVLQELFVEMHVASCQDHIGLDGKKIRPALRSTVIFN